MTKEDDDRARAQLRSRLSAFDSLVRQPGARPASAGGGTPTPGATRTSGGYGGSGAAGRADFLAGFGKPREPDVEVVGWVQDLKQFGDWAFATVVGDDGVGFKQTRITGNLVAGLKENAQYAIAGNIKKHPKYGESLEVTSAKPRVDLNVQAMVKFVQSNFKGVGIKSAQKFVSGIEKERGEQGLIELREQLLNEPWKVDFSSINRTGVFDSSAIDAEAVSSFVQRDLALRVTGLGPKLTIGLADYMTARFVRENPPDSRRKEAADPVAWSWRALAVNPYEPIGRVVGYGFAYAEIVARAANMPKDAPQRLAALVVHAVDTRCEAEGHSYLRMEQVKLAISRVDSLASASKAIEHAIEANKIVIDEASGEQRVYPAALLRAEEELAAAIGQLCDSGTPLWRLRAKSFPNGERGLEEKIQQVAKAMGGGFKNGMDASQVVAVRNILTSTKRLHTITAEPGAGKTAVMEVVAAALPGVEFVFCAPTGKGAKVLENRVRNLGFTASTIHSLLGGSPEGGFESNACNPLPGQVLVVDEGSMPDLRLAAGLMSAVNEDMHVIVLGDVDQLPSIGPGRFLADLLDIPEIDHNRLDTVHRNSGAILDVIHEVKAGSLNPKTRDASAVFSGGLPPPESGMQGIVAEYVAAVTRSGYERTALLMSRRQGEIDVPGWNTTYANHVLREVCNPAGPKVPGTSLCVGDRVIIKANMAVRDGQGDDAGEIRVVNGDTGRITSFKPYPPGSRKAGAESMTIALDDGRSAVLPDGTMTAVQLAYALTVHAAQGSEYKDVIAVITPGNATFINRNMLYTGLSRARERLIVHGEPRDLINIARTPMPARNSGLVARVLQVLGETEWQEAQAEAGAGDDDPRPALAVRRQACSSR